MVGKFGISPSEYWRMTPAEVSNILDANRPTHINGIREDDIDSMLIRRRELEQQGYKVL